MIESLVAEIEILTDVLDGDIVFEDMIRIIKYCFGEFLAIE
jgi:hypothetical protein